MLSRGAAAFREGRSIGPATGDQEVDTTDETPAAFTAEDAEGAEEYEGVLCAPCVLGGELSLERVSIG